MRIFVTKNKDKAVKDTFEIYQTDNVKVTKDGSWVEIVKNGREVFSGNTSARTAKEAYELAQKEHLLDSAVNDADYSLDELRKMRIGNYNGVDIYKIDEKFSTNPNTSYSRFNTLDEVKKYIEKGFKDLAIFQDDNNKEEFKKELAKWQDLYMNKKLITSDELQKKYYELKKKYNILDSDEELENKNNITDSLSETDTIIVEDAIYEVKRSGKPATIKNVLNQLETDMKGFLGNNRNDVIQYLKMIGIRDANIDKNKIEQIISSREFNFVKENGNIQTYKFIGQNPYDREYHYKELAKSLPGNVGLALSGDMLTVSYRDNKVDDAKMRDYQSYVGFAGAEKLKQDINNYNGNPSVFSYFLKPKQVSSIELMGAIINKQEYFLTMVMKTTTYKGDLNGAKRDAIRSVDEIVKTWKQLSYEDSAIKDYRPNVYKSSSYRIEEKLPNGYGIAQTYGDGLFYVFDKNGDVIDYPSYAFKASAVEAAKRMKDSAIDDADNRIFELGSLKQIIFGTGNFVAMENGEVYDKGFLGGSRYNNGKGWKVDEYINHLKSLGYKEVRDKCVEDSRPDKDAFYTTNSRRFNQIKEKIKSGELTKESALQYIDKMWGKTEPGSASYLKEWLNDTIRDSAIKDDDRALLQEYYTERQPNKKMELRHKLRQMGLKEGVSGVNSRDLMWVELNGKRYEVKNLSQVKALDVKDEQIRTPRGTITVSEKSKEDLKKEGYGYWFTAEVNGESYSILNDGTRALAVKDSRIKDYSVKHKGKQYIVKATSERDAALKVMRKSK